MKIIMYNEQDSKVAMQFLNALSESQNLSLPKMNKAVILHALRYQLKREEENLLFDKAEAAALWDKCDKSKPVATELYYNMYKLYKNRIRNTKRKLHNLRNSIRAIKGLK